MKLLFILKERGGALEPVIIDNKVLASTNCTDSIEKYLSSFLSIETKRSYRTDLLDFFSGKIFSEKDILNVTFEDVIAWRNSAWASQRLAPATINRKLTAIKKFFDPIVARGLMPHNPADPKIVKRLKDHGSQELKLGLSKIDMRKLIEACEIGNKPLVNLRDKAAILLAYSAMLRRSEVVNARWEDLQKAGSGYVLKLPKTKTGANDFVPLDERIFKVLNQYYKAVAEKLICTDKFLKFKNNYIFISFSKRSFCEPLTTDAFNRIVQDRARKASLDRRVSAHILRHTGISHLLMAQVSITDVQILARHTDPKTTMGYAQLLRKTDKKHISKLFDIVIL